MTPTFCCGFECGLAHWNAVGGATVTTTSPLTGLRSLLCTPTASQGMAAYGYIQNAGVILLRVKVRFAVLPNAVTGLANIDPGMGAFFNPSDNKIYAGVFTGALGPSGITVTTGVVYLIDIRVNTSASPWLIDVLVDGVACGQATSGDPASTADRFFNIGFANTCTANATFDDVLVSVVAADWPLGNGQVLGYVPNADGTHTATVTNIVKGTIGAPVGTAITSATTDAFNWVNARPLGGGATDANRLINQQTVATQYIEVDFEPSVEATAPRAVEVITADRQAGSQAGNFSTKLNDNGTEDVIVARTATGVVTDRFATKQYATMVGGGAWTLARFNALKARFGYSTDATPDQYWRGIMIEAEYTPAIGTPGAATGNAGTGAVGTMGVAKAVAFSGNAATGAVGTVVATKGATLALTGTTATGSVGTITPNQEQILRPISDIAANGWQPNVGLTLYGTLDEVSPDDADYDYSPSNPTTQYAEFLLSTGANPIAGTRTLTTRLSAIGANTNFVLEVMQGGSLVQTFNHAVAVGDGVVQFNDTLTGSVTNYADVRLRITASA